MPDKVIFLDVDGVLNSVEDRFSWEIETDKHMEYLKNIIDKTGAAIVVSSSWRILPSMMSRLRSRLKDFGMDVYSKTPEIHTRDRHRGDEIRKWLQENPGVKKFAILDDESDMREFVNTNFFKTDMEIGLTKDIADEVIKFLNS